MLLPSALPCDIRIQPPTAAYYADLKMRSPPPSTCQSPNSPLSANIQSTCRTLQSLLTTSLPTLSTVSRPPPALASPIVLTSSSRAKTKGKTKCAAVTKPPHTPVRAGRKRRRTDTDDGPSCDQENAANSKPSTPKRQRRAPLTLPLGLQRSDFEALEASPAPQTPTFQLQPDLNFTTPSQPCPFPMPSATDTQTTTTTTNEDAEMSDAWTPSDDSALVSIILDKLRLRPSDWDECARRLGKGKDSIGERWRVLVGEGNVGLRRSSGISRRKHVQLLEFGPEIGGTAP